jgi:hypothetical protein
MIHFLGCFYDNLVNTLKKLKYNFKIFDRMFNEWKNIKYSTKYKTIKIYVDSNHDILILFRINQKYSNLETIFSTIEIKLW